MSSTVLQKTWYRPSLMIFTKNQPVESNAVDGSWFIGDTAGTDYLFLTDDSRAPLDVSVERIEFRNRMINGRMRTYHVADKKSFSTSWENLPSQVDGISETRKNPNSAWAAGKEMLSWYQDHSDSFWLMLVYDTPNAEGTGDIPIRYRVETYNVFFESFNYTITKRGQLYDFWNVSMSLVEA